MTDNIPLFDYTDDELSYCYYTDDELYYCVNQCKYYNYYDGWCHYYDKDTCEIRLSECEIVKEKVGD